MSRNLKDVSWIVVIWGVLLSIVVIVSCGMVIWYNKEVLPIAATPLEYKGAPLPDAKYDTITSNTIKALPELSHRLNTIRKDQELILKRQDELVNDFRQEMNNNINKMNTWLAFSIGMMSIVGVFIPVLVQFHNQKEDKEFRNKLEKELTSQINIQKENLSSKVTTLELQSISFNNTIDQCNEKVEQFIRKKSKDLQMMKMSVNYFSFVQGYEDNILKNQPDRDRILRYMWCKVIDSFDGVLKTCLENDSINEDDRGSLITSLIMINSVVDKLKSCNGNRKMRHFDSIADDIRKLLPEMETGFTNRTAWHFINENLKQLNLKIQHLHKYF